MNQTLASTKWDAPEGWSMQDDMLAGYEAIKNDCGFSHTYTIVLPEWAAGAMAHGTQAIHDRRMSLSPTPWKWLRNLWWGIRAAWMSGWNDDAYFSSGWADFYAGCDFIPLMGRDMI